MPKLRPTHAEIDALRFAAEREAAPTPEMWDRALLALAPQMNSAALRLREKRAERRRLLWQALALGGCMVLFVAMAWLLYSNWEYLIKDPVIWRCLAGFAILSLFTIGCLPILSRKGSCLHE